MAGPYDKLPEPIDLDETVTSEDTEPVPDPDGGRDPAGRVIQGPEG